VCHRIKAYTSDLSDQPWETIRELLPLRREGAGRPVTIDMRQAINGMLYIVKTGSQWENLPGGFPHYQSVYYHYRKWCLDGTWERVNRALVWLERRRQGRCPYPAQGLSIAKVSKRPGRATNAVTMPASKSKDANGIWWSIRWDTG